MPRDLRERDPDTFHHVYARGNRRGAVFHDDEDRLWFLARLMRLVAETGACHAAHCLMTNHIHLLLRPGPSGVSSLMHRLIGPYAQWFNRRHGCVGHLFQGRFGSRGIRSPGDFIGVLRYVHRNPVDAGLVARAEDWKWSTHLDHLRREPPSCLREGVRIARSFFADDQVRAVEAYRRWVDAPDDGLRFDGPGEEVAQGAVAGAHAPMEGPSEACPTRASLDSLVRAQEDEASLERGTLRGPDRTRAVAAARRALCVEAVERKGFSVREVAAVLGRSHATISVILRVARTRPGDEHEHDGA